MTWPLVTVIAAKSNRRYGHVVLGEPGGQPLIVLADMGSRLRVHIERPTMRRDAIADLDPDGADALAAELTRWAARNRPANDGPLPGQLDLFEAEP